MGVRRGRERSAVAALCMVQAVDVLGVTVLVAALPPMLEDVGAGASMAGLLATSYAMSFGGLLMLGARLGDRLGHRRVLLAGLILFAAASALAAASTSLGILTLARCLQGAAAAASVPTALRLLGTVTAGERARRRALAGWSAAGAVAGAGGLLAGGVITSLAGWRAMFWLNLPLAACLIAAVLRTVPSPAGVRCVALDALGAALLTTSLMALILGASLGQQAPTRLLGAALVAGGFVLLALFARAQHAARSPLLPRAALGEPRVRLGAAAAFVNTATTSSVVTVATLYLQNVRHASPAAAGVTLLPFSLCVVIGAGAAGRLLPQRDPAVGLAAGLGLIAAGDLGLLLPAVEMLLPICAGAAGLGIGVSSVAATTLGTDVRREHQGAAAGIINTTAQLGTALGVSAAMLVADLTRGGQFPLHGPRLSWALAALLAGTAMVLALRRLRRGRPR